VDSKIDTLSSSSKRKTGYKHESQNMLVNPNIHDTEDIFSWEFNVLKIKDKMGLINSLGRIFESLLSIDNLGIYICMYICVYVYMCKYILMNIYIQMIIYVCTHIYI
jgi:hypothetical protein